MGCALTGGVALPCKEYVGGVRKLYFGHLSDFDSGVTVVSKVVTVLPLANVYPVEIMPHTASWTETATGDINVSFEQSFEFTIPFLAEVPGTATVLDWLENLYRGRWVVFIEDSNGNRVMMGRLDGAEAKAGEHTSGVAKQDLNGYKITLTASERFAADHMLVDTALPFDAYANITVTP